MKSSQYFALSKNLWDLGKWVMTLFGNTFLQIDTLNPSHHSQGFFFFIDFLTEVIFDNVSFRCPTTRLFLGVYKPGSLKLCFTGLIFNYDQVLNELPELLQLDWYWHVAVVLWKH